MCTIVWVATIDRRPKVNLLTKRSPGRALTSLTHVEHPVLARGRTQYQRVAVVAPPEASPLLMLCTRFQPEAEPSCNKLP